MIDILPNIAPRPAIATLRSAAAVTLSGDAV
jgi:hypothetical protein